MVEWDIELDEQKIDDDAGLEVDAKCASSDDVKRESLVCLNCPNLLLELFPRDLCRLKAEVVLWELID